MAPAAVRMVELEEPLVDLRLPPSRLGESYRSLLAVARLDGDPLGAAVVSADPGGLVPRERVAVGLRRHLEEELSEAFARRGLELPPALPVEGVRDLSGRPDCRRSTPGRSVSVVVATCRNPFALERCLRSILASDYDDFEVIVVENRPGAAATREMLAEAFGECPRLEYVEESSPGLSRARNAGLARAKGDVVAFTDDDVVVDPAWVRRCAGAFGRARDVACVTGLILPLELETDSQLLLEQFASYGKGFRQRTYRLEDLQNAGPLALYTPGAIGSGANTVVRTDVAWELGGFDTRLGAGTPTSSGLELDLYIRLLRAGHAVAYEPGAIVWHAHPDGIAELRRKVYGYGVGLGAMLTKQLVAGPDRQQLLRAVPAGIRYARDPASRMNAGKSDRYPRSLDWLGRVGMAVGPAAYVASALRTRRGRKGGSRPLTTAHGRALSVERLVLADGEAIEVVEVAPAPVSPARRPAERAVAASAVAACVAAPLFVALGLPAGLRFAAVFALLCAAPGTALISVLRGRAELGLVLGVSLAVSAVLAQSMLWLGAWHPKAYLYGLAAICLPPLLGRQYFSRRSTPATALERMGDALSKVRLGTVGHAALLTLALGAWAASLRGADLSEISGIGLLSAMPPTFFLAFALLLAGFALAMGRDQLAPKLLGLYVVALILVLHGTTPLLYDVPRYQWVYNHLAVVDLIAQSGSVDRHLDIYNNWPGFFALNAWLSSVSGLRPATYAPWAQVFFNLANVVALRFALRGVTRDERLIWAAVWLFVLGNWVGLDFLAPQAFGFMLSLVVLGLCLRCCGAPRAPRWRIGRWFAAWLELLSTAVLRRAPAGERPSHPPLSPRAAVVVGGVCYLAVVVSHQLTPVMLVAGVTGLAIIVRRVPLWVAAAMAVVEIWWLALAWSYITAHYKILDPAPGASAAPAGYELGQGLPGFALVGYASRVEFGLLAGFAAIGLVRRIKAARWDLAAVVLILAPALVIGVQSYSGEGRYRFYLFVLPWVCFFAAAACAPAISSRVPRALREWRLALVSGALAVCLLFAYYGLEYMNHVTADDVAAGAWFDEHAPRDSLLVAVTSNSISRVTAGYARAIDEAYPTSPELTDLPAYRDHRLGRRDLPRLEATLRKFDPPHIFLVLTESQRRHARLYGVLPDGWQHSLDRALRASPSFRLVYRRGASAIFEYRPRPKAGTPR